MKHDYWVFAAGVLAFPIGFFVITAVVNSFSRAATNSTR